MKAVKLEMPRPEAASKRPHMCLCIVYLCLASCSKSFFCTCPNFNQNRQVKLVSARHGTSCRTDRSASGRCTSSNRFPLQIFLCGAAPLSSTSSGENDTKVLSSAGEIRPGFGFRKCPESKQSSKRRRSGNNEAHLDFGNQLKQLEDRTAMNPRRTSSARETV